MAIRFANGFGIGASNNGGSLSFFTNLSTITSYLRNYMSDFKNPDFYQYALDGDGFYISDGGGDDMYDGGNATTPLLRSGVSYTGTTSYSSNEYPYAVDYTITGTTGTMDTNFGYRSLGYNSPSLLPLTVIGTRATSANPGDPIGFQVGGNIGADGGGIHIDGNIYTGDTVNGFTVHAFYSETYDAGDPSVCDVFILLGHPGWNSVFGNVYYGADSSNDGNSSYLYTSGNGARNILAIKTLLSKPNGGEVTFRDVNVVVDNFITRIGESQNFANNNGSNPVTNCTPTASYFGNMYFNSGTTLTWTDDTTGYSLYSGGFTDVDSGYSNHPIIIPDYFYLQCTGSTRLYIGADGLITFEVGANNWSSTPQGANPPYIGANLGDQNISTGASLSDGTTVGAYYRTTRNSNYMKIELKIFESRWQAQSTAESYQLNLYIDSTYQWIETLRKDVSSLWSYNTYNGKIGPTSSSDVSQVPSTTSSQIWRGDLGGSNWEYMGEGSIETTAPLAQYSNNGSSNNLGLIVSLDGTVPASGTTILDQSGNGNNFTIAGGVGSSSTYYDFTNSSYASLDNSTIFNSLLNTMSVTMWVNFPSVPSGQSVFSRTSGSNAGWAFRVSNGQFNLVKYNDADQYSNGSFSLSNNTWYHIGIVQGGSSLTFTVNGVIVGALNGGSTGNFANNSNTFFLCKDEYISSLVSMKLAKFKIYDTFKTSSDILTEFNNEKTSYGY